VLTHHVVVLDLEHDGLILSITRKAGKGGGREGGREAGREGGKAYLQKHGHLITFPFVSLLFRLCLREEAGVLVLPLSFLLDDGRREGRREGWVVSDLSFFACV